MKTIHALKFPLADVPDGLEWIEEQQRRRDVFETAAFEATF